MPTDRVQRTLHGTLKSSTRAELHGWGTDRRRYNHNRGAIARTLAPNPTTGPTTFRSALRDEHTSIARLPNSPQKMLRCTVTDRMLRDGCKLVDFDATLGYPGEGPDSGVQRMHAALAEAAEQACTDDVVRKRKRGNKYTLQDRHGRDVAFESMDTEPEDAASHTAALGSDDVSTSSLWVGDDMTQIAEAEEGFLGTVSFFNVDNLAFGMNAGATGGGRRQTKVR